MHWCFDHNCCLQVICESRYELSILSSFISRLMHYLYFNMLGTCSQVVDHRPHLCVNLHIGTQPVYLPRDKLLM